jgi:hypothetical protein
MLMQRRVHTGKCECSSVSRRNFLAASSLALSAPVLAAPEPPPTGDVNEYLDVAGFRPRPTVRIMSAVARIKPPYWLGWPGTSYDLEGHRQRFTQAFAESAQRLGVQCEQEAQPLESDAAVEAYVAKVKEQKPHGVLVMLQHIGVWHWADAIARAGFPTIIFAPVGMAFTGHVLEISRRPGVHVISSLETPAVEQAMRMIRAKQQMEATRLLVVAGEDRSETVMERLGTRIRRIPRRCLHELFQKFPVTDETRQVAAAMKTNAAKVVEPTDEDFVNSARSYQTAKRLMRDEESNGITTDCLGMVSTRAVPTPPCMGATLCQDAGVTYGCEADLNAALSMLLVSYLFDKPGFMNDPVPETYKNVLIAAHCTCGTKLNGFNAPAEPYIARSHSESNIGISTQTLWRENQPVTLALLQGPGQMIVDTGKVVGNVNTPPAGGCRTSFEISMDRMEDCRDVLGFHQVVFYGNHRRDLEAFGQMFGIKIVNSPERAPERKKT